MFGCSDPSQVLREVAACTKAFPGSYVRLVAFDNIAQCQTASFLVNRPMGATNYTHPQVCS
jgi:ribulose-bisphosphate carboxylase small chain